MDCEAQAPKPSHGLSVLAIDPIMQTTPLIYETGDPRLSSSDELPDVAAAGK
jgi:hypothetical protein